MGEKHADMPKAPHTHAGRFILRLGNLTTQGRLLSLRTSQGDKETKFTLATPEGKPVHQQYVDDEGRSYAFDELERTMVSGDTTKLVTKEAIAEAKKSNLPPNSMRLTVHEADQVAGQIFPAANNAYVFEVGRRAGDRKPFLHDEPEWEKHGALIAAALKDTTKVFLGIANISSSEGLYRLSLHGGLMIVQRQLYPENLNRFDIDYEAIAKVPSKSKTNIKAMIQNMVTPFDPEEYRSTLEDRLAQISEAEPTYGQEIEAKKMAIDWDDLENLFAESTT